MGGHAWTPVLLDRHNSNLLMSLYGAYQVITIRYAWKIQHASEARAVCSLLVYLV